MATKLNLRTTGWNLNGARHHYDLPATHAGYVETIARACAEFAGIIREPVAVETPPAPYTPKFVEVNVKHIQLALERFYNNMITAQTTATTRDLINAALTYVATHRAARIQVDRQLALVEKLLDETLTSVIQAETDYVDAYHYEILRGETRMPNLAKRIRQALDQDDTGAKFRTRVRPGNGVWIGEAQENVDGTWTTIQTVTAPHPREAQARAEELIP